MKEEGTLALYKGSVLALMLVSHGGLQFVSHEFLKGNFMKPRDSGRWNKSSGSESGIIEERMSDSLWHLVMGPISNCE